MVWTVIAGSIPGLSLPASEKDGANLKPSARSARGDFGAPSSPSPMGLPRPGNADRSEAAVDSFPLERMLTQSSLSSAFIWLTNSSRCPRLSDHPREAQPARTRYPVTLLTRWIPRLEAGYLPAPPEEAAEERPPDDPLPRGPAFPQPSRCRACQLRHHLDLPEAPSGLPAWNGSRHLLSSQTGQKRLDSRCGSSAQREYLEAAAALAIAAQFRSSCCRSVPEVAVSKVPRDRVLLQLNEASWGSLCVVLEHPLDVVMPAGVQIRHLVFPALLLVPADEPSRLGHQDGIEIADLLLQRLRRPRADQNDNVVWDAAQSLEGAVLALLQRQELRERHRLRDHSFQSKHDEADPACARHVRVHDLVLMEFPDGRPVLILVGLLQLLDEALGPAIGSEALHVLDHRIVVPPPLLRFDLGHHVVQL
eukprot:scaffold2011_cov233-Pinguiococcus_pyrenoidosus.AAC.1